MDTALNIVWLCPYPLDVLTSSGLRLTRPAGGHACSWIINLASALAARPGVELHLVTCSAKVMRSQTVRYQGYTVHVIRDAIPFTDRSWAGLMHADAWMQFWLRKRRLLSTIKAVSPDLVHGHGTEDAYALTAVHSGTPAVVSIQGVIAEVNKSNPALRYRLVERLERRTILRTQYAFCRTAFDTGFVQSVNPSARVFQIHEAMNPVFFKQRWAGCARPRLLFVGSFEEHKGLNYLLQALALLSKEDPGVELCVVGGDATDIAAARCYCRALGIEQRVEFAGFLPAEAIAERHLSCRAFVIPSTNDNSPNALAEAMVSGMPCVASAVGGIPSMIADEDTGLLFRAADVSQLAARLRLLLHDDERCRVLGAAAAKTAHSRHLPEAVAEATVAAYRAILADAA